MVSPKVLAGSVDEVTTAPSPVMGALGTGGGADAGAEGRTRVITIGLQNAGIGGGIWIRTAGPKSARTGNQS